MTDRLADDLLYELARLLRFRPTVEWLARHLPTGKPPLYVLGVWSCPWSGDEADPPPRRYWVWYRLYRWTRTAKHWVGWHDWHTVGVVDHPDPVYVQRHRHCDWCGANKPMPAWLVRLDADP